ncbi:hypothetical protein [Microcystis phage Mae-JY22]
MPTIPTNATRDAARQALERVPAIVAEFDLDRCTNTFGVAPCTASGTPCYNTRGTCRDKPNYQRGTTTLRFCSRGMPIPAGEALRPYIADADAAVTEIEPKRGLARRGTLRLTMVDEPDSDVETDPYVASRGTPAQGTFWTRLLKRNPHYVGRQVRVRRGYVVAPWTWDTFVDELYVIDAIAGPDKSGRIQVTLRDPLKLADRTKVPGPSSGKLEVDLKAVATSGQVVGATSTTVTLATEASAVDDAYNGHEIAILGSTGQGQRRVITDYVGATRLATVTGWSVIPETTSTYEVVPLSLQLRAGDGIQYADPGTSGKREFVRLNDEVIEYTAKAGDVLSWSTGTLRGQFGTSRADHSKGNGVQQCRAFLDVPVTTVVKTLLNESGIDDALINTAQLAADEATWYGEPFVVTTCLTEPETPGDLLADLLPQIHAALWWGPQTQKVEFSVLLPRLATPPSWTDEASLILGETQVETLDAERMTEVAIYYDRRSATVDRGQATSYQRGEIAIDVDAESAEEYGDRRVDVTYSRWFGEANAVPMTAFVARRLVQVRDAPKRLRFALDPKDYVLPAGELADVTTRLLTDDAGAPLRTRVLVTRVEDAGARIKVEARTTRFDRRYAFIAPNGTADHPTDTVYAHVSNNSGLMGDGSSGYLII